MTDKSTIIIVEASIVLRLGLVSVLDEFKGFSNVYHYSEIKHIPICFDWSKTNVLITNAKDHNDTGTLLKTLSKRAISLHHIGLISSYMGKVKPRIFQDFIYIDDDQTHIQSMVKKYLETPEVQQTQQEDVLTDREKQVLALLAKGQLTKEVAEALNISLHTVVSHRKNISSKLGIKSIAGLAIYAVANGIIDDFDVQ